MNQTEPTHQSMKQTQSVPKPLPMYCIRRGTPKSRYQGWGVHIHWKSVRHSKHFTDSDYGGMAQSLKVAQKYRDEVVADLPLSRQLAASRQRKNSPVTPTI